MTDPRDDGSPTHDRRLAHAIDLLGAAEHAVFFTGAGISTESGVPDYRGPDGVWTRRDRGLPPPPMRPWAEVEPNAGHRALVALQRAGRLAFLISQNVDGLHLASGIEPERLAELHGNRTLLRCLGCDARPSLAEAGWDRARWGNGYRTDPVREGQPVCARCDGRLISSVVNFGDVLPEREIDLAWEHAERADLFVIVGSSCVVTPAADLPAHALAGGADLIVINRGETPFDEQASVLFREGAGAVLGALVRGVSERAARG